MKVNENKTTALHTGRKAKRHWVTSTHVLCVQKNSIKCTKYENYAQDMLRNSGKHKKKQEILHARDAGVLLDRNLDKRITLHGDDIKAVNRFSYLRDVFSTEKRV